MLIVILLYSSRKTNNGKLQPQQHSISSPFPKGSDTGFQQSFKLNSIADTSEGLNKMLGGQLAAKL